MTKQDDVRITGLFPKQQKKVRDDIFKRRKKGYAVSTTWARARMTYHCQRDKPSGYDPTKHKFLDNWCRKFLDRHDLSIRRKTNKKKTSIFEKIHKIKNYHHYCVYDLADDDISSEESWDEPDSSSEEEDEESDVITSASDSESSSEEEDEESDSD